MEANKLLNAVIEQRDLGAFNSPSRPKPKKLGHRATNSQDRSEEGFFFFSSLGKIRLLKIFFT